MLSLCYLAMVQLAHLGPVKRSGNVPSRNRTSSRTFLGSCIYMYEIAICRFNTVSTLNARETDADEIIRFTISCPRPRTFDYSLPYREGTLASVFQLDHQTI